MMIMMVMMTVMMMIRIVIMMMIRMMMRMAVIMVIMMAIMMMIMMVIMMVMMMMIMPMMMMMMMIIRMVITMVIMMMMMAIMMVMMMMMMRMMRRIMMVCVFIGDSPSAIFPLQTAKRSAPVVCLFFIPLSFSFESANAMKSLSICCLNCWRRRGRSAAFRGSVKTALLSLIASNHRIPLPLLRKRSSVSK